MQGGGFHHFFHVLLQCFYLRWLTWMQTSHGSPVWFAPACCWFMVISVYLDVYLLRVCFSEGKREPAKWLKKCEMNQLGCDHRWVNVTLSLPCLKKKKFYAHCPKAFIFHFQDCIEAIVVFKLQELQDSVCMWVCFFFCAEQTQTFNALFINVLLQQIVRWR